MRAFTSALRDHVACGVLAAQALGVAEGLAALIAARELGAQPLLGPLLAGAAMAPAGAVVGVLTALAARLLGSATGTVARARAAALGCTLAVLLAALGAGAAGFLRFSTRLQDERFVADLAAFSAIAGAALLVALAVPLSRALTLAFERLANLPERWQQVGARLLPLVALGALGLVLFAFARRHAQPLGPLLALPYAGLLAVLVTAALHLRLELWLAVGRRARAVAVVAVLAFAASAVLASALHGARGLLAATLGPDALLTALERATDLDRDGQSGLFGGSDCAPFDPLRGPLARELAGNGIDEDCSGHDLVAGRGARGEGDARPPSARLPPELVARRHVFLIVIDALRADRLGLGAKRSLTPALDRLAKRSVVFTEAFSQSSATRMSFPSFLSGRAPSSLRWRRQKGWVQLEKDEPMLAELLKREGYTTGLVINRWIHDRLTRLRRGYEHLYNTREVRGKDIAPAEANASSSARAIEFVERALHAKSVRPMFLTVYYEGPHHPYVDHRARGLAARTKSDRDRYDSEVRYVDQEVGHFLDYLAVQPELAKNSVIAVIADHGEELGEHGGSTHGHTCYRESTHVPLIMHAPKLEPAKVGARVALTDLAPTLLALVGAPELEHTDGRNLIAASTAAYAHYPDERVRCAIFQDRDPKGTLIESVRDGDFLYVEHFGRKPSELYQTKQDRAELQDLATRAGSQPILARLRALIEPLSLRE